MKKSSGDDVDHAATLAKSFKASSLLRINLYIEVLPNLTSQYYLISPRLNISQLHKKVPN